MRIRILGPVILFCLSCSEPNGPRLRVGDIVDAAGKDASIELPSTVKVGEHFTVVVEPFLECGSHTAGSGFEQGGLTADVTPMVTLPPSSNNLCVRIAPFADTTTLTFPQSGMAIVRVHGRDQGTIGSVTISRVVTVLP